jgi:hypothetical protein
VVRWLFVLALVLAGVGACTLFDSAPPDDSCSTDSDCFRAQGEKCVDKRCEVVTMDAGVDAQ